MIRRIFYKKSIRIAKVVRHVARRHVEDELGELAGIARARLGFFTIIHE